MWRLKAIPTEFNINNKALIDRLPIMYGFSSDSCKYVCKLVIYKNISTLIFV